MMSRFKFPSCLTGVAAVLAMLLPGTVAHAGENLAGWQVPEPLQVSDPVFSEPHDVALSPDGLYLFVADKGHDAVEILVPGSLASLGPLGPGTFNAPHDVAFGANGRVYIADTGNGRIAVWQFDGVTKYAGVIAEFVEDWSKGIDKPEGIALGATGQAYVADTGANALLVMEGGTVIARITEADGLDLDRPHDVAVDTSGAIYLTDPGNNRVLVFNSDLTLRRVLDEDTYGFDEPKYLGLDEDGMVFVADQDNDRIRMLASGDFAPIGDITGPLKGESLDGPEGIAVDGRYIWISDTGNDRVVLLRRQRK
ncbi:MAG: hypothetical protein HQ501_08025 [Rhodospirillales bacterium]|nr:hypothetical protein [Rhodospirillales bacterium]